MQALTRSFLLHGPAHRMLVPAQPFATKISMALIKQLRERSGAGVAACKRAIEKSDGDLDAAFDELRKEGLAAAAKKASRVAAEGLVALAQSSDGMSAAMIELNSETDFVSRNDSFVELAEAIASTAHQLPGQKTGDVCMDTLNGATLSGGSGTVEQALAEMVGKMGENITLRRGACLKVEDGVVGAYVCLLYTSDAADEEDSVDLGGRRLLKRKK
eukprot:TRINITY_DN29010_c0_g1_i2.p2 TRINITY_DN29010_c0_g1~~TRINITY_DN29010_c0_g1_i2.p2  ORF type:complete len:216 (-),score=69.41 TRINITY_DN29010_c0_g1_i2:21-668(-)